MPRDQEIMATLTDKRFTQNPGLSDIFEDVGNFLENTWDSAAGTATKEAGIAAEKTVKDIFGNGSQGAANTGLVTNPTATQQPVVANTESATDKAKSFIKQVPTVVVAGGTTAVVKYVGKFGWITSIAAGVGAGAAKHFFIDKKGA